MQRRSRTVFEEISGSKPGPHGSSRSVVSFSIYKRFEKAGGYCVSRYGMFEVQRNRSTLLLRLRWYR